MRFFIVTNPTASITVRSQIRDLMKILKPFSSVIYVTSKKKTGFKDDSKLINLEIMGDEKTQENIILRILKYFLSDISIVLKLINHSRNFDKVIFFSNYPFSLIIAKLLKKEIIVLVLGNYSKSTEYVYASNSFKKLMVKLINMIYSISFSFADKIIFDSKEVIRNTSFKEKSYLAHIRFIEDNFNIKTPLKERNSIIGFVGRFSPEKGLINLIKTLPSVLTHNPNTKFVLIGDGPLLNEVQILIDNLGIKNNIKIIGWVEHDQLPNYLNRMKLLILPSFTEGLPNIILESMACGTPVLANSVGSIPDIIIDGKTGFIMEDNTPKIIKKEIIRALEYEELPEVVLNARKLIENDFGYETYLKKWEKIFE